MIKLIIYTGSDYNIYEVVSEKHIEIQSNKIIFTTRAKEKIITNLPYKIIEG